MTRAGANRRRFLKLVGATALTYPFMRALPSYAGDGSAQDPVFLVLLFSGCGVVRYLWGANGPARSATTDVVSGPLVFRDTLSAFTKAGAAWTPASSPGAMGSAAWPLAPAGGVDLTEYITVLDGLNNAASNSPTHEGGMASLWTGTTIKDPNDPASGPSIDQFIAKALNRPAINLCAQSTQDYYQQRTVDNRMLYDATMIGNWVDPIVSPMQALQSIWPQTMTAAMTGPKNNALGIRQMVLDQVNNDFKTAEGNVCGGDLIQLQGLQSLFNTAYGAAVTSAQMSASCVPPTLGAQTAVQGDPYLYNIQAMTTILALALACNLTSVASLQLSQALSPVTHYWLGTSQTTSHHNFSHNGPSSLYSLGTDLYTLPAGVTYPQPLIDIDRWYAQQVANLAYVFSTTKLPSGKSLLDQSVICWGSELDMGNAHNHDDMPFVLIGKGGGQLKANQLVQFPLNLPGNTPPTNNRFHNDLLLTLAKLMGVDTGPSFGTASFCTGPITEILA